MNAMVAQAMQEQQEARTRARLAAHLSAISSTVESLKTQFDELAREAEKAGRGDLVFQTAEAIAETFQTAAGESVIRRLEKGENNKMVQFGGQR